MQQRGVITIEKLYGGWIDTLRDLSVGNALESSDPNQYTDSTAVSLFTPNFEGHLAPGVHFPAMSDTATIVNGLALNGVVDSTGQVYTTLDNARLVNFTVGSTSVNNDTARYHDVAAAGVHSGHSGFTGTYSDIVIYPKSATANSPSVAGVDDYIFYSWTDSSDGDVGLRDRTAGTYTDNYLSGLATQNNGTALIYNVPHPLLVGQDNNLYVGNGRYLAKHDPTTTTVEYQALDLKPGWTISALSNYQNYIAILAYKLIASSGGVNYAKSEAKLFFWDGFSPSWNFEYYVRDNYAPNLLYDGTDLYVFTQGRSGSTKLKKFNGSGFDTVFESVRIGNAPGIGGSDLFLNHLVWGTVANGSGAVNAYGSPSDKYPKGFHAIGNPAGGTAVGMVKNMWSNVLLIGNRSGSNYTIRYSDYSQFNNNSPQLRTELYSLPTNSTITAIKAYHSQFGSGASYQIQVMKDYNGLAFGGNDLLNVTNVLYPSASYVPLSHTIDNVNSFYLGLKWNHVNTTDVAAIIRKLEVEYTYDDGNI